MAADETEVLRMDLDTSQVEKKAARVEQIVADIKAKHGKGEDVSDLERQLNKELDSLGQLAQQEKKATGTTEELIKAKEKLGGAVRIAGGKFSGAVADVGGLVEALLSGQKAVIGFGAALAGLSAVIGVVGYIRSEFARLAEEQNKVREEYQAMKKEFLQPQEQMANTLQQYAALTQESEKASGEMRRRLERAGFTREAAVQAAPLAVMEGMDTEQANLLAQLMTMGVQFEGPGTIQETIAKQAPEVIEAARRQLREIETTHTGMTRQGIAGPQPFGAVALTPEGRVREILEAGKVPEDLATLENIERVKLLEDRLAKIERRVAEGRLPQVYTPGEMHGGWDAGFYHTRRAIEKELYERRGSEIMNLLRIEEERELGRTPAAKTPELEGPPPVVTFVNIGSQYNAPDVNTAPAAGRIGLSRMAGSSYKTPLGGG